MIKSLNEECGVFGVFGHPDAARLTYYGLHSLQHRGQEAAGIVVSDGVRVNGHRGPGLVSEVFNDDRIFNRLEGNSAIGHVDMRLLEAAAAVIYNRSYFNFLTEVSLWHTTEI